MASVQAVIRYSFTDSEDGGQVTTALITAFLPGESEQSALNYLIKKYPERHNIQITELTLNKP